MTVEERAATETSEQRADATPKAKKAKSKKPNGKAGSAFLTAEQIFSKDDIKQEELYIEEWDGPVIVRGLTSGAHEEIVQSSMEGPIGNRTFNMVGYQAKMAIKGTYDDQGVRVFHDSQLPLLMNKASGPVSRISAKVQDLSGLSKEAVEKIKQNLELTPSEDSASD